ncbi:MAG: TolC family protein [Candidatus Zixiibacteriota bacterium]|nr:MAG: TolC family protein [candidate division Zixibacteria bacterium]
MSCLRLFGSLLIISIGLGTVSLADTVSREIFLQQLKQTHPVFQIEKLTTQIEEAERSSFLGDQDWRVQSSVFYSHDEPAVAISGPEKTDALSVSGGVERLFWSTGGTLSASLTSGYASLEAEPFLGLPESFFQNQLTVAYAHPLLRNKKGRLDRLAYDLKEFDIDLSEVAAMEREEDFLIQAASRFLDWVFLTEQHRIVTERLSLSEEELSRTREKRDANLVDEVDVIRAEDAVRIARQSLLLVESQWKALQAELAVLAQDSSYYGATPEYDLYQAEPLPSLDQAISRLKADSRLLETVGIRLEQLKTVRSGFMELEKPDLSLVARLDLQSAETAFGNSLAVDKPSARVGLQLGFPVENRMAKAKVTQTDLQAMQLEKQLEDLDLELSSAVANVLTQLKQLEKVLELNREQIESASRKTQEELTLYEQGRGELTFVIQSRDSEQAAQLTYAANALSYHRLVLQYQSLMDQFHR